MLRGFSTFPNGAPGWGLLLLRAATGLTLAAQGVAWLTGRTAEAWGGPWSWVAGGASIAVGALLLLGFLTPLASALGTLLGAGVLFAWLPSCLPAACTPATLPLIAMTAALLLLGPGAYSLDAKRFGLRELVIPPAG